MHIHPDAVNVIGDAVPDVDNVLLKQGYTCLAVEQPKLGSKVPEDLMEETSCEKRWELI